MTERPDNSVALEMSGRVYASILQRASACTLTLSSAAPFQVSILLDLLIVL